MANPNDTIGKSFQRGPGAEFLGARGPLEPDIIDAPVAAPVLDELPTDEPVTKGYAGRGPSRYRSTGVALCDAVVHRLTDHPEIDASEIEVELDATTITLRGNVQTEDEKQIAEALALEVGGVESVDNKLRVSAYDEVTHRYV